MYPGHQWLLEEDRIDFSRLNIRNIQIVQVTTEEDNANTILFLKIWFEGLEYKIHMITDYLLS